MQETNPGLQVEKFYYDNKIVKAFGYATVIFGIVGMLAGLWAAIQIYYPAISLNLPATTFGRLRPLHTNAIIFAFVGNASFAGIYYSLQRLCKARMFSDKLSWIHFWGWQLIIVAAAITLPLGLTNGAEYAELIWPIDIAIALVWIIFGINMFGTIIKRRENIYTSPSGFILPPGLRLLYYILSAPSNCLIQQQEAIAGLPECRMRWYSGGMVTMRWPFF